MSKGEIIKTIVEQHGDNERVLNSLFGHVIIEACKAEINKPLDLKRVRTMNESLSFLLEQIEICSEEIKNALNKKADMDEMNESGLPFFYEQRELDDAHKTIDDFISQRVQFENQIKNLLNEI